MLSDMLDRLQENNLQGQENNLQGLEGLLHSYQDATTTGDGEDQAAAEAAIADFFVDQGIGVKQSSRLLWDYHWARALAGKIPNRREHGAKLRSLLDRGAQILGRFAAVARDFASRSGHEVARLSQFEEQAKAFPLWVEECLARWEMLDCPRQPLNRERIARSQAAYERGECEDVADVIARLEQGGPFMKE